MGQTCAGFWIFTVKRQFEIDYRRITDIQMISNPLIGDVIYVKANGERYGLLVSDNADKAYGLIKKIAEYYEKKFPDSVKTDYAKDENNSRKSNIPELKPEKQQGAKVELIPIEFLAGISIEKVVGYIGAVIVCILAFRYLRVGMSQYEGNEYAFAFVRESVRPLGYMMHWGVVIVYAGFAGDYIWQMIRKKRMAGIMVMTGIPMFVCTLVMYIGQHVYEEIEFKDIPIIMYRVFGAYAEMTGFAFFVSIALIVAGFGVAKVMQRVSDNV